MTTWPRSTCLECDGNHGLSCEHVPYGAVAQRPCGLVRKYDYFIGFALEMGVCNG